MADEFSGLVALQFGGDDISGTVGTSAVDLTVLAGSHTAPTGHIITYEMPQHGCVRALSIVMETGVASGKSATLAATIDGTEDTTAVVALAASATTGSAQFAHGAMTFDADDGLGVSLTGGAGTDIVVQGVSVLMIVQFGDSDI